MYRIDTQPALEPLSLAETKDQLRVDFDDEDALITSYISGSRRHVERLGALAMITQTWSLILDDFPPWNRPIQISIMPVQSIVSVKYTDQNGTVTTMGSTTYVLDPSSGRLAPTGGVGWPSITLQTIAGLVVQFKAGFGDVATAVPEDLKQAQRLIIGTWYATREDDRLPDRVTSAVQALVDRVRLDAVA